MGGDVTKASLHYDRFVFAEVLSLTDPQQPGPFASKIQTFVLSERLRNRTLLTDIYLPQVPTPHPVIVISHGLDSDCTSFAYLAQHLASYGFAVVVPEHPGSNAEQLQALLEGRADRVIPPSELVERPLDISYVLDELSRLSEVEPGFQGRLNLLANHAGKSIWL